MTETETVEEEYMHRWRIQELGLLPNFPVMETQGLLLGAVSGGGGGDCSSTLLVLAGFATIALPLSLSPPLLQSIKAQPPLFFAVFFIAREQVIKERL